MNPADYVRAINTAIGIFEADASKIESKSFAVLVFAASILYLLPLIILRCMQARARASNHQVSTEGRCMTLFLEENPNRSFLSEKLEGQIDEIREQLENFSRCESLGSLLTEDLCRAKAILDQSGTRENAATLTEIFQHLSLTTSGYIKRHKEKLPVEVCETLNLLSYNLKLIARVCETTKLHKRELKPEDSLKNLKQWDELLSLYTEFVDLNGCGNIGLWLGRIANDATNATSKPYIDSPRKERHRRSLRNSAAFITQHVMKCEAGSPSSFAVGSMPRAKLLEETESRLHLLDLLTPSNDVEAKEQRETRQLLKSMLDD